MKAIWVTILLVTGCIFPAFATEKYVTDTTVNAELHAAEATWNQTYGVNEPDFSGNLSDFSQTATSADGTIKITLQMTDVGYSLDYGALNFDPLDPIQTNRCYFDVAVNKMEAVGSGSVTVTTPTGQKTYACTNVKMGMKNFWLGGEIEIESTVAFSDLTFQIDSSDYYFSLPCKLSTGQFTENLELQSLPKAYATLLKQTLKLPNSKFSGKARKKSKTKFKSVVRQLIVD